MHVRKFYSKKHKNNDYPLHFMKQFLQKLFGKKGYNKETKEDESEKQCCPEKKRTSDDLAVAPELFHNLLQKRPQIKLIDVRRLEEYNEEHIEHAQLLPVQELSQEHIDALHVKKDDEVFLYCRSGGRSGQALQTMKMLGYNNVKHLEGGILAWKEKNFSLEAGFSTGVSPVVSLKDSQLMENLEERENRPDPEGRA